MIADAVELPFLHQELFAEHKLPAPKGILLYARAAARPSSPRPATSLAKKVGACSVDANAKSYFLNIKGPELLNKYVATERQIRLVFQRARRSRRRAGRSSCSSTRWTSMFCTCGTGLGPDVESTIVFSSLAEIDGVESLRNVIVIGASNREDLIDPAILRPGRLDVKTCCSSGPARPRRPRSSPAT